MSKALLGKEALKARAAARKMDFSSSWAINTDDFEHDED